MEELCFLHIKLDGRIIFTNIMSPKAALLTPETFSTRNKLEQSYDYTSTLVKLKKMRQRQKWPGCCKYVQ